MIGEEPTLQDILNKIEEGEVYFRQFHKQCDLEEDYYFLRKRAPTPDDSAVKSDPIVPATARAIVDVATDHVDTDNIAIDIPLMLRSKARAERLKKFYQGVWMNIEGPVLDAAVKQAFLYGISWMAPRFKSDLWPNPPLLADFGKDVQGQVVISSDQEKEYKKHLREFSEKRKITFPFGVENINPKELIWDDSRTGPHWVIRTVSTTAGAIRKMFPQWATGQLNSADMTWREYWDDTYFAYLANNEFIQPPTPHGYGKLPFTRVISASAIDWNTGKPEDRYQGILHPVHSLLDAEARVITQIFHILRSTAWRTIDVHARNQQSADAIADTYEMSGGINTIVGDATVTASPMVQVPPDLQQNLATIQNMIEEATFPNVVRGMRPKGVSAGFAVSVLAGMGRLRFRGVAKGMGDAIAATNAMFARMVEFKARGPVTVHARSEIHSFDETIGPEDIKGYYENKVTLKAEAPEEREREGLLAMNMWQSGFLDKYEALRRAGVTNPLKSMNQRAAEDLIEAARAQQAEQFIKQVAGDLQQQQEVAAGVPPAGGNAGQFQEGQPQLQRPGEAEIQRRRVATRNGQLSPSTFPQGFAGLDRLGRQASTPNGGSVRTPAGRT